MDQPEDLTTDRLEGAPPPGRLGRARTRRLVAVATGTTLALGAGGVAYAASSDEPTPTPSNSTPSEVTPDEVLPDGDRPHGPGGFVGGGGFGVLHGEAVVETEDGTYETVATQRGTIDEITDDSVTVTSEDGYTATYVLEADALASDNSRGPITDPADLAVGDEVVVMANVEGSTATVERLIDLADLPEMPGHGFRGGPHGDRAPEGGTANS